MRGLAPVPVAAPVVRFETEPGRQMQADWASVGRGSEKLSVFIGTMGWSRAAYIEFCDNERVETLISCHDNAFRALGGVPVEALLDNMKTVVIERNVYGQGLHRFHPAFLDYARHAGFVPRLCAPYRPQTKGKVERFIGYLKRSFWIPSLRGCGRLDCSLINTWRMSRPHAGCARLRTRVCMRRQARFRRYGWLLRERCCRLCRRPMPGVRPGASPRRRCASR